ncbi:Uncharacterized protein Adt_34338 [Abeliophyllum distichum]|uniref:Putative plant transposon protein domain-containing protein n=1 Tax=Abeliophyllum distichum TaxID=126358 RepID=A0ABD1R049_9LAMI
MLPNLLMTGICPGSERMRSRIVILQHGRPRCVTRNARFHGMIFPIICWNVSSSIVDRHKVADAPHAAYPTLVREFFANFNPDIDVPKSPHKYKTWVRGQWIRFSPTMIDRYYGLTRTEVVPLPSPHELDMALVARYLYCQDDAWPLATPRFMHDQLTRELRVLHIFVSSNINPTRQRTRFTEHRAILLHHLARLRKIDLGAHIFEFIRELATAVDSQRTIHFSCLISGLCLTQGVSLFPTKEADLPTALLNARSIENSEDQDCSPGWQSTRCTGR